MPSCSQATWLARTRATVAATSAGPSVATLAMTASLAGSITSKLSRSVAAASVTVSMAISPPRRFQLTLAPHWPASQMPGAHVPIGTVDRLEQDASAIFDSGPKTGRAAAHTVTSDDA